MPPLRTAWLRHSVLLPALFVAACQGDAGAAIEPDAPPVSRIELDRKWMNLQVGTFVPVASIVRDGAGRVLARRAIAWSSSNPSVATVSAGGGVVTAVAVGEATITARVESTVAFVTVRVQQRPVVYCDSAQHLGCGFGPEQFAPIAPGSFRMGSDRHTDAERPSHDVTLTRRFEMQRTEVTQHQWRTIMGTNPSSRYMCGDTCPVEQVSWDQVQLFIQRLNAANPGARFRLPTEAEWEYAARGGSTDDRYGPLDSIAWSDANRTHPAAEKWPNAFGLYDMLGNIPEIPADIYGPYTAAAVIDPTGPATAPSLGPARAMRGANMSRNPTLVRSSYREGRGPLVSGFPDVGFRLARDP